MSIPLPSQVKFGPKPTAVKPTLHSTKSVGRVSSQSESISVEEVSREAEDKRYTENNRRNQKPVWGKRPTGLTVRPFADALAQLRETIPEEVKGPKAPRRAKRP